MEHFSWISQFTWPKAPDMLLEFIIATLIVAVVYLFRVAVAVDKENCNLKASLVKKRRRNLELKIMVGSLRS